MSVGYQGPARELRLAVPLRLEENMNAKDAAVTAKQYLIDLLSDEAITPPTLEEIWLEPQEDGGVWYVTLAVRRRMAAADGNSAAAKLGLLSLPDLKVVRIADRDGKPLSVRDRMSPILAK